MAYSTGEENRVVELFERIRGRKEHPFASPTFRDSDDLMELLSIADAHDEKDVLGVENNMIVYHFLADCYKSMGRAAAAEVFYKLFFDMGLILGKQYFAEEENMKDKERLISDAYEYAYSMNCYQDNSVDDLKGILGELLCGKDLEEALKNTDDGKMRAKTGLVKDPVEMTAEYLSVIDEVEKEVSEKLGDNYYMGKCFEIWELTKSLLADYGIDWHTPSELNPGVIFD